MAVRGELELAVSLEKEGLRGAEVRDGLCCRLILTRGRRVGRYGLLVRSATRELLALCCELVGLDERGGVRVHGALTCQQRTAGKPLSIRVKMRMATTLSPRKRT